MPCSSNCSYKSPTIPRHLRNEETEKKPMTFHIPRSEPISILCPLSDSHLRFIAEPSGVGLWACYRSSLRNGTVIVSRTVPSVVPESLGREWVTYQQSSILVRHHDHHQPRWRWRRRRRRRTHYNTKHIFEITIVRGVVRCVFVVMAGDPFSKGGRVGVGDAAQNGTR